MTKIEEIFPFNVSEEEDIQEWQDENLPLPTPIDPNNIWDGEGLTF